jgi:hypothetical protein
MISKLHCNSNYVYRVVELKSHLRMEKENNDENLYEKMKKTVKKETRSKEREKSKSK